MATFIGLSFPFRKSAQAFPAPSEDADLIKESLKQILLTQKGERVMRPDFGADVYRFVFENNHAALATLIQTEVARAIGTYEPRVILLNVTVDRIADNAVMATIYYIIPATGQKDEVQVPLGSSGSP
jgi:phage baseplate assembly protein W